MPAFAGMTPPRSIPQIQTDELLGVLYERKEEQNARAKRAAAFCYPRLASHINQDIGWRRGRSSRRNGGDRVDVIATYACGHGSAHAHGSAYEVDHTQAADARGPAPG